MDRVINGAAVRFNGLGVLILGESGSGKSEAALRLIQAGGELIADDRVVVQKSEIGNQKSEFLQQAINLIPEAINHAIYPDAGIMLKPHPAIRGLLHSRSKGFLHFETVEAILGLIVVLESGSKRLTVS